MAIEHANKVLELDPSNKKAILRRAKANAELGNYDDALKDLRLMYKLEPSNATISLLMHQCSDLPKMDDKLRYAYVKAYIRCFLQKTQLASPNSLDELSSKVRNLFLRPTVSVFLVTLLNINLAFIQWQLANYDPIALQI